MKKWFNIKSWKITKPTLFIFLGIIICIGLLNKSKIREGKSSGKSSTKKSTPTKTTTTTNTSSSSSGNTQTLAATQKNVKESTPAEKKAAMKKARNKDADSKRAHAESICTGKKIVGDCGKDNCPCYTQSQCKEYYYCMSSKNPKQKINLDDSDERIKFHNLTSFTGTDIEKFKKKDCKSGYCLFNQTEYDAQNNSLCEKLDKLDSGLCYTNSQCNKDQTCNLNWKSANAHGKNKDITKTNNYKLKWKQAGDKTANQDCVIGVCEPTYICTALYKNNHISQKDYILMTIFGQNVIKNKNKNFKKHKKAMMLYLTTMKHAMPYIERKEKKNERFWRRLKKFFGKCMISLKEEDYDSVVKLFTIKSITMIEKYCGGIKNIPNLSKEEYKKYKKIYNKKKNEYNINVKPKKI